MDKTKIELVKETAQKLLKFFTESSEEKFEGVKIKDSDQVLEYGVLEIGSDVSISTATGSEPAPDGEYPLVNDVIIEVKDGKISEIKSTGDVPEDNQELAVEDVAAEEVKPDETAKSIADLDSRITKIESTLKTMIDSASAQPSKEDLKKFSEELSSTIGELAKIPTQFSNDTRVDVQENEMDKYKRIAEKYSKK